MNIEQLESTLRSSIQALQNEIIDLQSQNDNLDQDSEDLNGKIERKFAELTRNRARQSALMMQRPAHLDEMEKVEEEIVEMYDAYVVNSRCLFFLEQKLEEFDEAEKIKLEVSLLVSLSKRIFSFVSQTGTQQRDRPNAGTNESGRIHENGKSSSVTGGGSRSWFSATTASDHGQFGWTSTST